MRVALRERLSDEAAFLGTYRSHQRPLIIGVHIRARPREMRWSCRSAIVLCVAAILYGCLFQRLSPRERRRRVNETSHHAMMSVCVVLSDNCAKRVCSELDNAVWVWKRRNYQTYRVTSYRLQYNLSFLMTPVAISMPPCRSFLRRKDSAKTRHCCITMDLPSRNL